ncbi:hypothetical protein HPB52_023201 [Rhipicephalus sanguineus]|uniref:Uncharacterized protein n=1 Tax=Rhipicephalus sanguineus TaxID=34632 RepID=A0A9D4QEF0_RHISA|nr:hypothetical protein HPB52_023201 [Rhipicephalus sanguineus]
MVACTSRRHGAPASERGMRPHKQRGKGRGNQWISDRLGFWCNAGGPRRPSEEPGGTRRSDRRPGPTRREVRPADQASTHYRRSGSGPPQDEETTGRGLGKRQPPFLACLSQPGRRCLRATTTGPAPRDRHRLGLPGPAAAWTPCCPDLLPGQGCPALGGRRQPHQGTRPSQGLPGLAPRHRHLPGGLGDGIHLRQRVRRRPPRPDAFGPGRHPPPRPRARPRRCPPPHRPRRSRALHLGRSEGVRRLLLLTPRYHRHLVDGAQVLRPRTGPLDRPPHLRYLWSSTVHRS